MATGTVKEHKMGMCILSTGNAFDGVWLYGPFKTHDDALKFAESLNLDADRDIAMQLRAPSRIGLNAWRCRTKTVPCGRSADHVGTDEVPLYHQPHGAA